MRELCSKDVFAYLRKRKDDESIRRQYSVAFLNMRGRGVDHMPHHMLCPSTCEVFSGNSKRQSLSPPACSSPGQ